MSQINGHNQATVENNLLYSKASEYLNAGLSVIPCKEKKPLGKWKEYQTKPADQNEVKRLFSNNSVEQIAVICGAVSGGLEIIDLDLKNDTSGTLWELLWDDLLNYFNNHMPLLMVHTPSGGVHLYYRFIPESGIYDGNQKLARLERGKEAVIETRGEGGYAIAPPSPKYDLPIDNSISEVRTISEQQRNDIIDICRKYNNDIVEVKRKQSPVQASAYIKTPWDAYDNDNSDPWLTILEDKGWTVSHTDPEGRTHFKRPGSDNPYGANWHPGKRIFYNFTPNGGFEPSHGYRPSAIHAIIKCGGDFKESTRLLIEAGYGQLFTNSQENFISAFQDHTDKGLNEIDVIKMLRNVYINETPGMNDLAPEEREKKADHDLEKIKEAAINRKEAATGLFWMKLDKGKIAIAKDALINFLRDNGYRLLAQEESSILYRLVRIDEATRIIEEVAEDVVMKWVENWINDNIENYDVSKPKLILALVQFKDWTHTLKWMPRVLISNVSFLRDQKNDVYLPFKNCIIHITKDDIQPIQYSELPAGMLVWKNQIKDTEIELPNIDDGDDVALNECPVFRFVKRVSGIMPEKEWMSLSQLEKSDPDLHKLFISHLSILGYLMSNYKDPGRPYAVIIGEDTAADKKGGGTGKDLLMSCVKKIRGVSFLPGKLWKATSNFAFQTYKLGDDILYIGDPPKFFDFEMLYNTITEGLTMEKKNKDALVIPYELSPKVVISTNYSIDDVSEHAARRQVKMLLTKYYSESLRVEDELGGQFWSEEWAKRDWMLFYFLMFTCIQIFLDGGVQRVEKTDNSKEKAVKINYGDEFFSFIQDWIKDNINKWADGVELYNRFLEDSTLTPKEYSRKRFTSGLDFFADTYGFGFNNDRISSELGKRRKSVMFTKTN